MPECVPQCRSPTKPHSFNSALLLCVCVSGLSHTGHTLHLFTRTQPVVQQHNSQPD